MLWWQDYKSNVTQNVKGKFSFFALLFRDVINHAACITEKSSLH
jgi:hypothetical protein